MNADSPVYSPVKMQTLARCVLGLVFCCLSAPGQTAEPDNNWLTVIRNTPYADSQGVAENLATIRHWVLFSESYCANPARHLLLDSRWRFVAYMDDDDTSELTLNKLNDIRQRLADEGRVSEWYAGTSTGVGYPFALACHQPFVNMQEAIARLTGSSDEYRLWGTWDGMTVGARDNEVSLIEMFHVVVETRRAQERFTFPDSVIPTLLGKVIIESGGQKEALSSRAARGIMQLRPEVLDDCEVAEEFRLHRIVQVDCALRLMEQNHRNLQAPFNEVFGHLPDDKRDTLYGLLLTQAYQIGVGRTLELLLDEELGNAARYFGEHHERFSAEDMMTGMIYHNMGRKDLGLLSLYYVTDARLAQRALCETVAMTNDHWCEQSEP